jgi:predicted ATP-dependent endonuclease of OLD family
MREGRSYESIIDFRLESLSNKLVRYFSKISTEQDNEIHKFQQDVLLSVIEFPSDDIHLINWSIATINNSKAIAETLESAFRVAKIEEERIRTHIDEFKSRAEAAIKNYSTIDKKIGNRAVSQSLTSAEIKIVTEYLSVTQKIAQSRKAVQMASSLQERLNVIQSRKNLFVETANELFINKQMIINSSNDILFKTRTEKEVILQALSSGEKQMLVLLSEMFLQDGQRSILIADEPELSLHVTWQEKLIDSLKSLNPHGQIIVATHSPDIVGRRADRVINVDEIVL